MTGQARPIVRLVLLGLALSVLVAGPLSVAGASTPHAPAHTTDSPDGFSATPEDIDPDQVRMNIALTETGTAEWTVEFWVRLDDNESTEAFESLSQDIDEDPEPYLTRFADRIESTTGTASTATDRTMSTDGFAVETERQSLAREYGVVVYTFDWHGFAVAEGSELRAGDAIDRLYLDEGTRLLVSWPDEYDLSSANPEPDDHREQAVIWRGTQTEFVSGEPRVVVSSGATGISTGTLLTGVAVLGGVGAGIGFVIWYRRRRAGEDAPPNPDPGSAASGAAEASTDRESGPEPAPESTADDPGTHADADTDTVPMEFLSNEERVLRVLEENGGRMKQQAVVSELGWTDTKTSKVVSGLREEGELESFRLGRENVLTLPDQEDPLLESDDTAE